MTADALRVVLLLRSLGVGGAERQAVLLARMLAQRGHIVTVMTFYSGGALESDLVGENVELFNLGKRRRGDVVGFGLRLRSAIRERAPDVVYSFLTVPNLLTMLVSRQGSRPKLIWGVRASNMKMDNYDWLSRLTYELEGFAARRADAIVANSEAGGAIAVKRGMPEQKLCVIRNGVDLERFTFDSAARARVRGAWGVGETEIVVGHMARVDPMKDHDTFIRAMVLAARERRQVRAVIATVGSDKDAAELETQIASNGAGAFARVLRMLPTQVVDVLCGFDVFCSSSAYGEGFSNVLCEALSVGLVCVSTDVGDARDIIGDSGFVCAPRDSRALSHAIIAAVQHRQISSTASAMAARARADVFPAYAMVEATESLLMELTA